MRPHPRVVWTTWPPASWRRRLRNAPHQARACRPASGFYPRAPPPTAPCAARPGPAGSPSGASGVAPSADPLCRGWGGRVWAQVHCIPRYAASRCRHAPLSSPLTPPQCPQTRGGTLASPHRCQPVPLGRGTPTRLARSRPHRPADRPAATAQQGAARHPAKGENARARHPSIILWRAPFQRHNRPGLPHPEDGCRHKRGGNGGQRHQSNREKKEHSIPTHPVITLRKTIGSCRPHSVGAQPLPPRPIPPPAAHQTPPRPALSSTQ